MYKSEYVCDYCGKDMGNSPEFTVMFKSNGLAVYEPKEWHYCEECWSKVKKKLANQDDSIEELKKENEKLKKDAKWYENFFSLILNAFINGFYKDTGYGFTITTTNKEDKLSECCCENTNRDSLNYSQTTWGGFNG